jgi:hypothetical protein
MLVSLNPGSPLDDEPELWTRLGLHEGGACTVNQAHQMLAKSVAYYDDGRTPFHRISVAIARSCMHLLDASAAESDWREFAWMTDLFKCSTEVEVGPAIPRAALRRCAFSETEGFLRREIELLEPRVLIALGGRAKRNLINHPDFAERVVSFRHPSGAFWRLDSTEHDGAFERVAELLGAPIPSDFRQTRGRLWDEAFRRDARTSRDRQGA